MSKQLSLAIDDRLNLAIGCPAYGGQISAQHAKMWLEFGNTLGASADRFRLVMHSMIDVNPISKARNMLLEQARQHKADWLLMIDADTWVEASAPDEDAGFQLLRMISDAARFSAAIVAAPVVRRRQFSTDPDEMMVYTRREGEPIIYDPIEDLHLLGRSLIPIDAAATAVFALDVNFATSTGVGAHFAFQANLSEDLNFCRIISEAGGKIFCDTRVRTGHQSRPFALYSSP